MFGQAITKIQLLQYYRSNTAAWKCTCCCSVSVHQTKCIYITQGLKYLGVPPKRGVNKTISES